MDEKAYTVRAESKDGDISAIQTDSRERALRTAQTMAEHIGIWKNVRVLVRSQSYSSNELDQVP